MHGVVMPTRVHGDGGVYCHLDTGGEVSRDRATDVLEGERTEILVPGKAATACRNGNIFRSKELDDRLTEVSRPR